MLTIVGIYKDIYNILSFKANNIFIFQHFSFYEQLKFDSHLSMKKLYNLRNLAPRL